MEGDHKGRPYEERHRVGAPLVGALHDQQPSCCFFLENRLRPKRSRKSVGAGLGLKPDADQHQIRHARRQQRDQERGLKPFAGGFEGRFHDGKNIRRFYAGSPEDSFSRI